MKIILSPSVLEYDPAIEEYHDDIQKIIDAGAGAIHVDRMEPPFVKKPRFFKETIRKLHKLFSEKIPLDFHLMERDPMETICFIEELVYGEKERNETAITIHREAFREGLGKFNKKEYDLLTYDTGSEEGNKKLMEKNRESGKIVTNALKYIKKGGFQGGLALEPGTSLDNVNDDMLKYMDRLFLMTVRSGEGGQSYIPEMTEKIVKAGERYSDLGIEIDGGINRETLPEAMGAGAKIIVIGSAITKQEDPGKAAGMYLKMTERYA